MKNRLLRNTGYALLCVGIVFFVGNIFLSVMNYQMNHNEHMYVTAGVLIQDHRLYKDFSYLQMPYLPMLYGATYALTKTTYYFFIARLYTFVFVLISMITLYIISIRISASVLVSVIVALFFLANEAVIESTQEASNYSVSIAFSLLGLYACIVGVDREKLKVSALFIGGLCCAIAFGAKLYYGIVIPVFLLAVLVSPQLTSKLKIILWFTLGVVVGSLPIIYYFFAGVETFIFNNIRYHTMNTTYMMSNVNSKDTLFEKTYYAWRMLLWPLSWMTLVCSVGILVLVIKEVLRVKKPPLELQFDTFLICFLGAATTLIAFIPSPMQKVYLSMPIPFLVLIISCIYRYLGQDHKVLMKAALVVQACICFILGGPQQYLNYADTWHHPDDWIVFSVHQTASNIRVRSEIANKIQKIATLSPIYAIESGTEIYTELATGPFLYRIGDRISSDDRKEFIATSPKVIGDLFSKEPPKAIFVGFEDEDNLDQLLIQYAEKHHYTRIRKKFDGGILYVLETHQ